MLVPRRLFKENFTLLIGFLEIYFLFTSSLEEPTSSYSLTLAVLL